MSPSYGRYYPTISCGNLSDYPKVYSVKARPTQEESTTGQREMNYFGTLTASTGNTTSINRPLAAPGYCECHRGSHDIPKMNCANIEYIVCTFHPLEGTSEMPPLPTMDINRRIWSFQNINIGNNCKQFYMVDDGRASSSWTLPAPVS